MIGYKLLRSDLSSLSDQYGRHKYSAEWTHVPGNGAYVALTLPGLLRGGMGEVFAQVEYAELTGAVDDDDVVTARRVRVLRHAPLDLWAFVRAVIWGARQVLPLEGNPLRAVCLRAVEAADRCERERTSEAADAASGAWADAWVSDAAVGAARWSAKASAWAAEASARAARGREVSAAEAVSLATREAARAGGTDLARRLLEQLAKEVF